MNPLKSDLTDVSLILLLSARFRRVRLRESLCDCVDDPDSITIFTPCAVVLPAFPGKAAGETVLISLGQLDRPDKLTLACLTDFYAALPGDFLDLSDFHFSLSLSCGWFWLSTEVFTLLLQASSNRLFLPSFRPLFTRKNRETYIEPYISWDVVKPQASVHVFNYNP